MPAPLLLEITLFDIQNRQGLMTKHVLYNTWRGMIERCKNPKSPNYKRYGGQGISVYLEWQDKSRHPVYKRWSKGFCCFLNYIEKFLGEKPKGFSLDRLDSNGNYSPGNLRWASPSLQKKNQTVSNLTGYKYVYKVANSASWQGEYKNGNLRVYVGCFKTKEQAYFSVLAHRLEKMWPF
jgi:hypothetical protein